MNELQEKIESTIITKTFHINGMPESLHKELDAFCKENYGDARWIMIKDFYDWVRKDYRFELLHEDLEDVKGRVASLEKQDKPEVKKNKGLKTFGGND